MENSKKNNVEVEKQVKRCAEINFYFLIYSIENFTLGDADLFFPTKHEDR